MIRGTTISGNSAAFSGGGVQDIGGGAKDFTIVNYTISGNHAGLRGGAILQGGGAINLLNTTLHDNTADTGANEIDVCLPSDARCGGNPSVRKTTVQNSIVASAAGGCLGAVTSAGHNIDSGDTCGFRAGGDQIDTDPLLGPLASAGSARLR